MKFAYSEMAGLMINFEPEEVEEGVIMLDTMARGFSLQPENKSLEMKLRSIVEQLNILINNVGTA